MTVSGESSRIYCAVFGAHTRGSLRIFCTPNVIAMFCGTTKTMIHFLATDGRRALSSGIVIFARFLSALQTGELNVVLLRFGYFKTDEWLIFGTVETRLIEE